MASLIKYPDNIREHIGMNTTVFSCNVVLSEFLRQNLSDEFSVISANLENIDLDKYDWIEDALYRSHIIILDNDSDNFIVGFLTSTAMGENPIRIMTLNLPQSLIHFVNVISKDSADHFVSLELMMKELNDY